MVMLARELVEGASLERWDAVPPAIAPAHVGH
jgi:hypothetical protein